MGIFNSKKRRKTVAAAREVARTEKQTPSVNVVVGNHVNVSADPEIENRQRNQQREYVCFTVILLRPF